VVRRVVAAQAPAEVALLDGLDDLGDDEVTRLMRRGPGNDGPVGFGLPEAVALATPVVWLVVNEVATKAAGAAAEGAVGGLKRVARMVLRRGPERKIVPPLTPAQLREVHERTVERALAARMSEGKARALADSVVAELALRDDDPAR